MRAVIYVMLLLENVLKMLFDFCIFCFFFTLSTVVGNIFQFHRYSVNGSAHSLTHFKYTVY